MLELLEEAIVKHKTLSDELGSYADRAKVNVKHSAKSAEWYTPKAIVESARLILGHIDLDPASCKAANQVVKATQYYDKMHDGLNQLWSGTVFCNPPGGKLNNKSIPKLFWQKLMSSPEVKEAIFLAFSMELLQTSQIDPLMVPATAYAVCIPKRRLKFTDATGNVQTSNTHASAIIYTGHKLHQFAAEFSQHGSIMVPYKGV